MDENVAAKVHHRGLAIPVMDDLVEVLDLAGEEGSECGRESRLPRLVVAGKVCAADSLHVARPRLVQCNQVQHFVVVVVVGTIAIGVGALRRESLPRRRWVRLRWLWWRRHYCLRQVGSLLERLMEALQLDNAPAIFDADEELL